MNYYTFTRLLNWLLGIMLVVFFGMIYWDPLMVFGNPWAGEANQSMAIMTRETVREGLKPIVIPFGIMAIITGGCFLGLVVACRIDGLYRWWSKK